jgi:hypothetical protein
VQGVERSAQANKHRGAVDEEFLQGRNQALLDRDLDGMALIIDMMGNAGDANAPPSSSPRRRNWRERHLPSPNRRFANE